MVALGLRLWRLDSGLWVDEVFTLIDFVRVPFGQIVTSFPSQNQNMFFSVLARASVVTFGESAWSLRLPAALFGALTVWPVFLMGRRLIGVPHAIAASALLAVSYHHVWFSQNARGYSGLLFFSVLATWLWFEAQDRQGWWWIAYALSLVGGMWMHLTMIFIVASHGLVWLVQLGAAAWRWHRGLPGGAEKSGGFAMWAPIGAWVLAGTLTLQLYALALPEFLVSALHEGEGSPISEWTSPIWAVAETVRGLSIGWLGVTGVLGGAFVAAYGWLRMLRRDAPAAALMVLPGILGGGAMLALGHNMWPRFFFFCAGFAILVVINGAMELPKLALRPLRGRMATDRVAAFAGVGMVVVMIVISAATVPRNYALPKQDFAGAREFVERERGEGETIVAVGLAGKVYSTYFAPEWLYAEEPSDLTESRRLSSGPVWLVYTIPIEVREGHPEIWRAIEDDFEVVKVFYGSLGAGEVYVCRER